MKSNYSRRVLSGFLLPGVLIAAGGMAKDTPEFIRIQPVDLTWQEIPSGHGVKQAVLFGDPSKAGFYVMRVRFPPYTVDVPHWHPNARYVTVIEGTWYTGTGDAFDFSKAVPLKAGSFMIHPAKASHWDGSGGPETVVVQIMGEGPATTTQVDPSKPFWMDVPH
jgi:quercetin dioxygenase-like cupin family protein